MVVFWSKDYIIEGLACGIARKIIVTFAARIIPSTAERMAGI